jgi:hypothetical protein
VTRVRPKSPQSEIVNNTVLRAKRWHGPLPQIGEYLACIRRGARRRPNLAFEILKVRPNVGLRREALELECRKIKHSEIPQAAVVHSWNWAGWGRGASPSPP